MSYRRTTTRRRNVGTKGVLIVGLDGWMVGLEVW